MTKITDEAVRLAWDRIVERSGDSITEEKLRELHRLIRPGLRMKKGARQRMKKLVRARS